MLKLALAQEKELGELKSRFVSMASHEFRTPLTAILATTETLTFYREKMNAAQIDSRLDKIRQQVVHMKNIMEDVLQLARIQAGRVEFSPTQGELAQLCQEIIEEYESQAPNRGRIVYTCQTPGVLTDFDTRLMRQVISNLISNALKYSPPEQTVQVDLLQNDAQVVLQVTDRGIGIPAADLPRLFEPFHRAANVGVISGTGLGLSITKQAVDLHSGTITVTSQVDVGTTFTVSLPQVAKK
jgi:signal transduction histidine kinase